MADRYLREMKAYQPCLVQIYGRVDIGATGAPTLVTANGASHGIASIARTAAGDYTVVLDDTFNYVNWADAKLLENGDEDINVIVNAVDEDKAGGAEIKLTCLTGSTATDPSDGSALMLCFVVKNSSVAY